MPEVFRYKNYRFFFFSRENSEPIHIHVESSDNYAKFWIFPVHLAKNFGFKSFQLSEIRKLIEKNKLLIIKKWDEHFNNQNI